MGQLVYLWLCFLLITILVPGTAFTARTLNLDNRGRLFSSLIRRNDVRLSSTLKLDEMNRCEKFIHNCRKGGPHHWGTIGLFIRYLNQVAVGAMFGLFLHVFNKIKVHHLDRLLTLVEKPRVDERPLLTISNHQSMMDDPGLWGGILPWWRISPEKVRWSICTEDVFFSLPILTPFMATGNTIPLDRSGSLNQESFEYLFEKLNGDRAWCHIFPEGRIWQDWRFSEDEPHLGPFKVGVGKMIAHCQEGREPIIVPMIHKGMDQIIPEVQLKAKPGSKRVKTSRPAVKFPLAGKKVDVFFGKPFDVSETVRRFRREHPGQLDSWDVSSAEALALYQEIADEVRVRMLELEATARASLAQKNGDGPEISEVGPPKLLTA